MKRERWTAIIQHKTLMGISGTLQVVSPTYGELIRSIEKLELPPTSKVKKIFRTFTETGVI